MKALRYFLSFFFLVVFATIFTKFSIETYDLACHTENGGKKNDCSTYDISSAFLVVVEKFVEDHDRAIETASTFFVALFTFTLWRSTDKLGEMGEEQGEAMEKSIAESARAATAMEKISGHMEISAKSSADSVAALKQRTAQQMRAYVSVAVGTAIFQNVEPPKFFEAKPMIINTGHTPAHKIAWKLSSQILQVPLPADFTFPLAENFAGNTVLGPQQTLILNARAPGTWTAEQVEATKTGDTLGFYVWGIVSYVDVFDDPHETKFCQQLFQYANGGVWGCYIDRHNEAN